MSSSGVWYLSFLVYATSKNPQRIGTGVVVGKYVYMANEQHIAQCIELESGKERWHDRMPGSVIWASPVLVENRLYVPTQNGSTIVFRPNPDRFELLAENELDEPSNSTLAISDGQIFLRTFQNLYCIGE